MNKETGGPAFPIGSGDMRDPTGMTLRDYFAAKAMQAIINETSVNLGPNEIVDNLNDAKRAYRYADAMLEARK